jgi:outer membrane protein
MMRRILNFAGLLCLLVTTSEIRAQKTWTLEECINYAHDNNLDLKRQQLQSRTASNNYNWSRAQALPTANAFAGYRFNKGRAPNYDTYTYVDRAFEDGNVGITSGLDIFNGLSGYNTMRQNKFSLLASLEEIESLKNEITIQIASAYLQVLLNEELLSVAEDQLEITRQQVDKNRKLVEVGNLSRGELYEIEAQEARERASITRARNTLSISYLDLMQYMDLENVRIEDFNIDQPDLSIEDAGNLRPVDSVYADALRNLPVIKSAEYNLRSLEKGLSAARGLRSPNLSMRYQYYTLYSELSTPLNPQDDIYRWQDQLKDKGYQQLTFSLNIPITNRLNTQRQISNAKVSVLDAEINLDMTKQSLFKNIQQVYVNAVSALDDYKAGLEAVESMQEAFRYTEQRFDVGIVNSVDYNVAKNDLIKTQSDLLSAKYQYIFYTKMLELLAGNRISL